LRLAAYLRGASVPSRGRRICGLGSLGVIWLLIAFGVGIAGCGEDERCPRGSESVAGRCRLIVRDDPGLDVLGWPPGETSHEQYDEEPRLWSPELGDAGVAEDIGTAGDSDESAQESDLDPEE